MAILFNGARLHVTGTNGDPLAGGWVYTYIAGTTTPKVAYSDSATTIPLANPFQLDAYGEADCWLVGNYKILIKDANLVTLPGYPVDYLPGTLVSAVDLAATTGAALVGWIRNSVGAVATTVAKWMERRHASVFDFMSEAQQADVVAGTASIDVTAAIQAAMTAKKVLRVPAGRYKISSTLVAQPGQRLIGDGPESTIWQRIANYGNTLTIGNTGAGTGALNFSVTGIWFYKPQAYTAGTTTTIDYPVTASSRHLEIVVATGGKVEDCWFTGMPYGLSFEQSSLCTVKKCQFSGLWDPQIAGLQESIASVWLRSNGSYNVSMRILENSIAGGYASVARNVVVGTATLNFQESVGPQYGLLCDACEDLVVDGNYFGGQSVYGIKFDRVNITAGVKILGNFFDPAINSSIFTTTTTATPVVGMLITGNNFNGQNAGLTAIRIDGPGSEISVTKLNITGNEFENYLQCMIAIAGARGATISSNGISNYNFSQGAVNDPSYTAGIYVYGNSTKVFSHGNSYGGGTNLLGVINYCQWGIYYTASTKGQAWDEKEVSLGLSGGGITFPAQQKPVSAQGYVSTNFYPPYTMTCATGTTEVVSDTLYAHPLVINDTVTIAKLYCKTATTNAGSGSSTKAAIYSVGANGAPSERLATCTTGVASTGADTVMTITLDAPVTLLPGIYYIATLHTFTTTAARFYLLSNSLTAIVLHGATSAANLLSNVPIYGYSATATFSSSCPATFGTATAITSLSIMPFVGWSM